MTTASGKFGGTFTPTAAKGDVFASELIRCSVSDPLGAQWVINLAAWTSVGTSNRNATGTGDSAGVRATVTWTGGGPGGVGREVAEVDYPAAGTTFQLHATDIVLSVHGSMPVPGDVTQAPTLAAWATVNRSASQRPMTTTLTNGTIAIVSPGSLAFPVPPRARSFRILIGAGVAANVITATQFTGNVAPSPLATDFVMNGAAQPDFFAPPARCAWIPLSPDAQLVQITNVSGAPTDARIQWLLELG